MFAFSKNSVLVSYIPKKKKKYILPSSLHDDGSIDSDREYEVKPEIITFYNLTKGAVDVVDELKGLYSVARISCG